MTVQGEVTVSPTVSKKNTSYGLLTSWLSNVAFKKLTNFGGMPDYFENLNLGKKNACFKEFKPDTIININHKFILIIITKFSKRHFCG